MKSGARWLRLFFIYWVGLCALFAVAGFGMLVGIVCFLRDEAPAAALRWAWLILVRDAAELTLAAGGWAAALTWFTLFIRRRLASESSPTCETCGYDLTGNVSGRR